MLGWREDTQQGGREVSGEATIGVVDVLGHYSSTFDLRICVGRCAGDYMALLDGASSAISAARTEFALDELLHRLVHISHIGRAERLIVAIKANRIRNAPIFTLDKAKTQTRNAVPRLRAQYRIG